MKRLLMYDYFRGQDSTGLASIRCNGDVKIAKIASHPLDLFDTKKFADTLNGFQSKALIGHNRASTRGATNAVNAHPYQFGHIVGAHNGTLEMSSWKALEEAVGDKFDVDSQAVFAAIAKLGIEETVKLLQGAWALTWYDLERNTLNFLRNKERPFWYAYTKELDRVFWASEWPMIDLAVKSSSPGYELHQEEKGYKFWGTKEDWWYRYDLDELKKGASAKPKPRVKELKGKEPTPAYKAAGSNPFPQRPTNSTTNYRGGSGSGGRTGTGGGTSNDNSDKVVHLIGTKTQPLAGYVTEEKFKAMSKYGCGWCSADVEFNEPGVTIFEGTEQVLCPSCAGGENGTTRIYVNDFKRAQRA